MKIEEEEFQFPLKFITADYLPRDLIPFEDGIRKFSDLDREIAFIIAQKLKARVKTFKYEHWIHLLVVASGKIVKIATIDMRDR